MAKASSNTSVPTTSRPTSTRKSISDSVKTFFRVRKTSTAPTSESNLKPSTRLSAPGNPITIEFGTGSDCGSTFTPVDPHSPPPSYSIASLPQRRASNATATCESYGVEEDLTVSPSGTITSSRETEKVETLSKEQAAMRLEAIHRSVLIQQDRQMAQNLRSMGL